MRVMDNKITYYFIGDKGIKSIRMTKEEYEALIKYKKKKINA